MERTLSIIKPDATKRSITGKINAIIEEVGLSIIAQKRIILSEVQAQEFYGVHKKKPFFKDLVKIMLLDKFEKYIERFKKNEFYYFLAFRLSGGLGIPFGLQNILPVIFNVKNSNYFFGSFLGFIPMFFIWNSIGSGINNFIKGSDNFNFINLIISKEIYIPILIFLIFISISILVKKFFFK